MTKKQTPKAAENNTNAKSSKIYREIRTFVRRTSKLSEKEQALWDRFGESYLLEPKNETFDFKKIFSKPDAKYILEIGTGKGDLIANSAYNDRENCYIGVEVYKPGVARTLKILRNLLAENGSEKSDNSATLDNIKLINYDAIELLKNNFLPNSIDEVRIFFPDPWQKKRHNKRRMINESFLPRISKIMKPGAILKIATDWEDYANQIKEVFSNQTIFEQQEYEIYEYNKKVAVHKVKTRFELRAEKEHRDVHYFVYKKL